LRPPPTTPSTDGCELDENCRSHSVSGRAPDDPQQAPIGCRLRRRRAGRDARIQAPHRSGARFLEQMPVKVRRDLDAGVSELPTDVLQVLPGIDQQAGVRVPLMPRAA
jgi:hypothetical protein